MGKLTALRIKSLQAGRHGDGDGLYLLVKPTGARSWILRVQRDGQRQDVGLGSADLSSRSPEERRASDEIPILARRQLTLAEAREKAAELRRFAKAGRDPIVERDRGRRKVPTFKEAAEKTHVALKAGWSAKGAKAFLSSLEEHAYPRLGRKRVDQIEAVDVHDMLEPIWQSIPEMAKKVRNRTIKVLDFAKSKGWRETEAPRNAISIALARQPKGGNFKAMPYADVPAFVADLRSKGPTNGRRALLFQILTAARPGEVRGARWDQIDIKECNWNRPAALMKGRNAPPHTVTLNDAVIRLLRELEQGDDRESSALIFPGKHGAAMSDMTLRKVLIDAKLDYDAHGFRSSFRDWAAEKVPAIPDPVAEAALAHGVPDKVVAAYKRTEFVEMRRMLLQLWGEYVWPT